MKKHIFILITLIILFIQGCNTEESQATVSQETNSVLIPLYSYPTHWQENEELTDIINTTDGQFISIINPHNGPGFSQSSDYIEGIDYLYNKNTKIIAYIYTSYGDRDKQEIYDDIDSYISFYGAQKITGIFFDEVNLDTNEDELFVKEISTYAKSKLLDYIVLNPGTRINQSIIDENYYDIIVTYEESYDNYISTTNTLNSSAKTKQSLLIYNYLDLASYESEIQKAKSMNYDFIYFTTATKEEAWSTVFNFLK